MTAPASNMEHTPLVSEQERARITSGTRMSIALLAMVAAIVAGLTLLIVMLVSRVFDSITPAITADIEWKARHGAVELSRTAELGLLVQDSSAVREAAADYIRSPDVLNVLALSADGQEVFAYGQDIGRVREAMSRAASEVHAIDGRLVAWAPAMIEGAEVGRVAVAMSTSRLRAGDALRRQISLTAVAGGGVAMLLALGFVALYIWPVLRLTRQAFLRLELTTEQALEAVRLKAQFLANMSHEIRTPMNAVVGLSKLMLDMPLSDKLRRYAEMIDASSRSLLAIINDVLDFSKLEAGKYQIVSSPCEIASVVQEVAELLAGKADEKRIDLVYRIAPTVPRLIEIDGDRVRQVLTNLVGNAVKFTEQGEVYVSVDAEPESDTHVVLRVRVQDSGPGVPEALREQIFEAFSQGDGSLVRKHGGTGLGLAISRELLRLMGGSMSLSSELGKGSVFSFVVPARVLDASSATRGHATSLGKRALVVCDNVHARAALAEHITAWGMDALTPGALDEALAAGREAAQRGLPVDVLIVAETQSGPGGGETLSALRSVDALAHAPTILLSQVRADAQEQPGVTAQLPQPVRMSALYETVAGLLEPGKVRAANQQTRTVARSYRGARVLVVDDNKMNQFVAAEQLATYGCTVDQAYDGQQALSAIAANHYDVVFMDCQMPVMDGYTATRLLRERERPEARNVVIALTAHALDGERDRVLAAGMDDYLTKPLRPQALQQVLERWLSKRALAAPAEVAPEPRADATFGLEDCSTALLQLFLEQVPAQVELLDGALAAGDDDDARARAHKLKGSLLTVNQEQLAAHAQAVQHAVEAGQPSDAELALLVDGVVALEKQVRLTLAQRARKAGSHG